MKKALTPSSENFYDKIKEILESARNRSYMAVNFEMVQAYWNIGRSIVEEEQAGRERAEYGKYLLSNLSIRLTAEYGKGFDYRNLAYMRQFYQTFPNMNALRSELSWTHYRILIRVDREQARQFYLQECVEGNWSTRQLERQINSLYFERILMSSKKGRPLVKKEADGKKEVMQPGHIIKDPYVLEFLNLNPYDTPLFSTTGIGY